MLGVLSCFFSQKKGGSFKVDAQTPIGAEILQLFRAAGSTAAITKLLPAEQRGSSQHDPLDFLAVERVQVALNISSLMRTTFACILRV